MLKVTVIGMNSAYPSKNQPSSGYLVETEHTKLLLDCGSGVMMTLAESIDLDTLDHIFISHDHPDHIADLGVMQHRRLVQRMMKPELSPLHIYSTFTSKEKKDYYSLFHSELHSIHETRTIGDLKVTFEKTIHPVECHAIKIEVNGKKLVYTADTAFSETVLHFSADADLLITESSLYPKMDGSKPGHMNIEEAVNFGLQSRARKVVLSHLPVYGPLEKMQAVIDATGETHIQLAEPNMTIEL